MIATRHYHRQINLEKQLFLSDILLEYCYKFGLFPNPLISNYFLLMRQGRHRTHWECYIQFPGFCWLQILC